MSVWKRNAVVLAIVLFVGAAVYLNWSYNSQLTGEASGEEGDGKVLGQTTLVNGVEEETEGETAECEIAEGQGETSQDSGYFASARLNRQQARDSALELLQEAAADEQADQTVIDEANASIQTRCAGPAGEPGDPAHPPDRADGPGGEPDHCQGLWGLRVLHWG